MLLGFTSPGIYKVALPVLIQRAIAATAKVHSTVRPNDPNMSCSVTFGSKNGDARNRKVPTIQTRGFQFMDDKRRHRIIGRMIRRLFHKTGIKRPERGL